MITPLIVPASFALTIEDINEDSATFLWKDENSEEGYYIKLNSNGKLLSLSQPANASSTQISEEEQQQMAEQFIKTQYNEALEFFTLSNIKTKPESKRYYYKQLVYGIPLQSAYCTIEISNSGQIVNFEYKNYKKIPPQVPNKLAAKEHILEKLKNAEWIPMLVYLSSDYYTVPQSGLYVVYHSSFLYHSFDAATGKDFLESVEEEEVPLEEQEKFVPIPQIEADIPLTTIEEIIGLTPSMVLIRKSKLDDGNIAMVWRDQKHEPPTDKSMNTFVLDRFEQTV